MNQGKHLEDRKGQLLDEINSVEQEIEDAVFRLALLQEELQYVYRQMDWEGW